MSQVISFSYDLSGPFGEFGSKFKYEFNIVYMIENILSVGLNNTNVVVIPGDITEDSKTTLVQYHIDTLKWKKSMLDHLNKPEEYHSIIQRLFNSIPENIQKEYIAKFGDPKSQIQKMKPIK